jgi:hypothetical protein
LEELNRDVLHSGSSITASGDVVDAVVHRCTRPSAIPAVVIDGGIGSGIGVGQYLPRAIADEDGTPTP